MRPLLGHAPGIEHDDVIGQADIGEPVGDHHRRLLARQVQKRAKDLELRQRIQVRRRLIDHEQRSLPHVAARESHLLPLPSRQVPADPELPTEKRLVSIRKV